MIQINLTRERAEALRDQIGTYTPYGASPLWELFNELDAALDKPPVPPARAFVGEPSCGKKGCACGA